MPINPLTRSSPIRMMGLSSGLDTDHLIQQMMRVHQMRIDKQFRTRTIFEWKQQTQNSVKDQIDNLRSTFLRSTGATGMLNRSMYNAVTTSVTGANSSAVTIRAGGSAPTGTMKIDQVVSLAKCDSVTSGSSVSVSGNGLATSTQLGDISLKGGDIFFNEAMRHIARRGALSRWAAQHNAEAEHSRTRQRMRSNSGAVQ